MKSNNCYRNGGGIILIESDYNNIEKNCLFRNYDYGIYLSNSNNNKVNKNMCISTGWWSGISLGSSNNNQLFNNQINDNYLGIYITHSDYNVLDSNNIEGNVDGICLAFYTNYTSIICNNLVNNSLSYSDPHAGFAINLDYFYGDSVSTNRIHHNNLNNNGDSHESQALDSKKGNSWNNSFGEGNYWSDYLTRYPDAENDGNIWKQPYELDGDNPSYDFYPLVYPVEQGMYYPVAIVNSSMELDQHETITFDGERCYDHLGITNYTWDLNNDGDHIRLYGISPEYTFHEAGTYTVRLTVTNTQRNRDRATSTITVRDTEPPVSNAGPDSTIELYQTYRFDGSASRDNVGIVNYTWLFGYGAGWRNLYGVSPHFTFDIAGNFQVTLWVYDANGNYAQDWFILTAWDSTRPTANAGYDIFIDQHEMVVFNGSRSMDNVGVADYAWHLNDGDNPVILNGETCPFIFHNAGKYIVTLNVSDDEGNWDTDDLAVTVMDITPPIADAGSNITTFQNTLVTFNGTNSTDNTGLVNYTWTFKYNHRKVFLYGPDPDFFFALPGLYEITLKVWDLQYNLNTDHVWVKVIDNEKPQVKAGNNTTIYGECSLRLDGSHCTDNVGIANYTWIIEYYGKIFTLYGPHPEFRFQDYGIYEITLYVTDHEGNVGNDTFNITAIEILETNVDDDNDNNIGDMDPEDDREPITDEYDFEIIIWMGTLMVIFIVAVIALLLYFLRKKDPDPIEQSSEDEMGRVVNDDGNGNDE